MSVREAWIKAQLADVSEDGTACASIHLEGPDGTVWGTWRADRARPDLVEAIEAQIGMQQEELSSGRHRAKLVAHDGSQRQIAILPITLTGRSAAASAAATEALAMQRAVAMMVQNAEAVTAGLRSENERLRERNDELVDHVQTAVGKLLEIQTSIVDIQREQLREDHRAKRIDDVWQSMKPLAEAGMDILGGMLADKYKAAQKRQAELEDAKHADSPQSPPAGKPDAKPTSDGPNPSPGPPPDGGGSDPGPRGGSDDGGRESDGGKPPEPAPETAAPAVRRRTVGAKKKTRRT